MSDKKSSLLPYGSIEKPIDTPGPHPQRSVPFKSKLHTLSKVLVGALATYALLTLWGMATTTVVPSALYANDPNQQGYVDYIFEQSAHDASVAQSGLATSSKNLELEQLYRSIPSPAGLRQSLRHYANHTHLAGSDGDLGTVKYTAQRWSKLLGYDLPADFILDSGSPESQAAIKGTPTDKPGSVRVFADTYYVWNTHPKDQYLALSKKPTKDDPEPEPFYTPSLQEDEVGDNLWGETVPAFHAYSKNGTVKYAPIVYANFGTRTDFEILAAANVSVKGAIVLVRYGHIFRGLKVRAAAEAGAAGVLIFTDTAEDGEVTEANEFEPYPDGPARQPSSLQRGSVQALSFYPGDPGTPYKPSYANATRLDPDIADSLPTIPSLPISYRSVAPILRELQGNGLPVSKLSGDWQGTVPGVDGEYWTGPSTESVLTLSNSVELPTDKIWNVYAKIQGYTDETVVIGNHRDAWGFGAVDPNSGSAVFEETIRGFGQLLSKGWKPLRTLLVASWDAEETGLGGSTEFVEDYADWVADKVVAYFNLDVAVAGSAFGGRCSPSLYDVHAAVSSSILDPTAPAGTNATLGFPTGRALGSGSDFTPFLQHVGIASSSVEFSRKRTDPVYHYHSTYDSFAWVDKFGDPGFLRHRAITELIGVVTLKALNNLFVPINATAYADELKNYIDKVHDLDPSDINTSRLHSNAPWQPLYKAAAHVLSSAKSLDRYKDQVAHDLQTILTQLQSFSHPRNKAHLPELQSQLQNAAQKVRRINKATSSFERNWIDKDGLPERKWYRNLVVAPGRLAGYGEATLPAVTEAITLDHGKGLNHEIGRLIGHFYKASNNLLRAGGHS